MRSSTDRRHRWMSAVAVLAACAGSNGKHEPPQPIAPPQPSHSAVAAAPEPSAPEPSASVAPQPQPPAQISAWTDDGAIAALAKDCHWDANGCLAKLHESARSGSSYFEDVPWQCRTGVALACAATMGQMCTSDVCAHTADTCYPECNNTCQSCAGACVDACESCKAPCDARGSRADACRLACAKSCGACRQACVKELDHCTSGDCGEVADKCFHDRDAAWNKGPCAKVCPKVVTCVQRCPDPDAENFYARYDSACAHGCFKRLGKGCPESVEQACMGNPNYYAPMDPVDEPSPP